MLKFVLPALILFALPSFGQQKKDLLPDLYASFSSYASSGKDLPFWFSSNQNGIFNNPNSTFQLLQFGFEKRQDSIKNIDFFYGSKLVGAFSDQPYFQPNQYWAAVRLNWLVLKAGAQADPVLYDGLSSTNGNMDWSNNARPLPGASLSTNDFIPFFFFKKWFSFKARYDENLLLDKRYVSQVHLHHKALFGRVALHNLKFTLGLDHWVYWGGISPDFGPLPQWDNYFQYIFALKGGVNTPKNEHNNALGNSLGLYLFTVEKSFPNATLTFYYNHPFEDRSGLEMDNAPDGLWGLFFQRKNRHFLSGFLYEFQNTTNQSGTYNMVEVGNTGRLTGRGNDNYFNNFIYKSGHVHYNHMMGSPFFIPVIENGISKGFTNTRIIVHHAGLDGWVTDGLSWKALLSWSRGFGTYDPGGTFPSPLDQLSFLTALEYSFKNSPFRLNAGLAADYGDTFEKRAGVYAGLAYRLK